MKAEIIVPYKGYVIRTIWKSCLIAIPKDVVAVCYSIDKVHVDIETVKATIDRLVRKKHKEEWTKKATDSLNIHCPKCKYDQFFRPMGGEYRYMCGQCKFKIGKKAGKNG